MTLTYIRVQTNNYAHTHTHTCTQCHVNDHNYGAIQLLILLAHACILQSACSQILPTGILLTTLLPVVNIIKNLIITSTAIRMQYDHKINVTSIRQLSVFLISIYSPHQTYNPFSEFFLPLVSIEETVETTLACTC